ncbi:hypothetical protein HHK36_000873 [Tetracentron sinense]|uniref:tRNA (guanine(46)-N(7))-methyltransferase n=1 Tax=Tetracentron sinense TaxID=13715 RepID=A0A834ZSY8_TETSI|nr:hypothetical protein HHK36_000873 [Tetracentron sinense]
MPRARSGLFSFRPLILNYYRTTTTATSSFRVSRKVTSMRFSSSSVSELRSPDLVALEYADLNLKDTVGEVGHLRIRQHVNPLSASLRIPAQVPDWNEVFRDSALPLMVDIGTGSGRFLIWLAKRYPESKNYLGLEIRRKLVKRAQFWVKEMTLSNIYFMFANATVSFEKLVSTYPGPLMLVSILVITVFLIMLGGNVFTLNKFLAHFSLQCPDPYFKKRHHKRRVVQKPLVDSIVKNLSPGGEVSSFELCIPKVRCVIVVEQVFLQSDVVEVALDMRNQFDAQSDVLEHIDDINHPCVLSDSQGWLLSNPMGIRTEREIHAESEGVKIYRRMYKKRI